MSRRTTVQKVQSALGGCYGTVNGQLSDLGQWIESANATVNQVVALLAKRTVPLQPNDTDLELMERYTAAYFYSLYDPGFSSRSTEGASGSFVKEELAENRFKALAIQRDPSGLLRALLDRRQATTISLGPCS